MTDLWKLDAAALHEGYRRREFTPSGVLESCLARIRDCEPQVNAFVHVDETGARSQALESTRRWERAAPLGALDGIPVSFKDNVHVRGMPTRWGSACLDPAPREGDELPVARLREAGAVLVGKTNLPEFALQGITDNLLHGVTRNPWNTALTPGGSSGGAAAAVAYGAVPIAIATDGGGSTRRPASHCGVVGFKPSSRAVPRAGGLPQVFGDHETAGIIARRVCDVDAVFQVLGPGGRVDAVAPQHARILFVRRFAQHPVDPRIDAHVSAAAQQLAALGCAVTQTAAVEWAEEINALWPSYSARGLARWFDAAGCDESLCGDAARATLRLGREAEGVDERAARAIATLETALARVFADFDAILTPATACLPWPVGESHCTLIDGRPVGPRGHAVFTAFANAAGLPAIALPCGFAGELPAGLQLVAARGADRALLALASALESTRPCNPAWPPLP